MLPKTRTYVKSYDEKTKWMYSLIKDDELLVNYNNISNKFSLSIKKELDCELIYSKNFLKTKIKSHGYDAIDFHNK